MAEILNLQADDDEPLPTPGDEKVSMVSYLQCHHSGVSYVLCQMLGRRR
ncbi:MAG: hypothetical protein R2719_09790 [Micropruina sp.]|nr:hypothetical protein [Micropruina sp.]